MSRVVIDAHQSGGGVGPNDVLSAVGPEAESLVWSILDLHEVVVHESSSLDSEALYRRVESSANGLQLSLAGLRELANDLTQVIDGLCVGCQSTAAIPNRTASDAEALAKAEVAIAALDSTFWLISGPESMLDGVRSSFTEAVGVDAASLALTTRGR